ncbi:MAG: hypothetical protein QOJ99_5187 [Bryobacterales bacterium]|jgi:hypothetical protein|nr:hypothetical protein [Bryobacterales bacterium]
MRLIFIGMALCGALVADSGFDEGQATRFARLALDCVHQEYPNKIAHSMESDADVKPPRELTPAFYGCYDWHSSVHGHWLLVRLARLFPQASFAADARRAVGQSLTGEHIAQEVRYLSAGGRSSFERPYGLAWLLQLVAETEEWDDSDARGWREALRPLEAAAVARIAGWLPKLEHPIRTGEHNNTAFGLGLMLDYARITGNTDFGKLVTARARDYYLRDRNCPLPYEPSGEDFLSPCLAEADMMRRVLPAAEFEAWYSPFLPALDLEPTHVADVTDGKLYHLAGLNLSRAWMIEGILSKLPAGNRQRKQMGALAGRLRQTGLETIRGEHYEGGHWLGSFAVYLVSGRGLQ